MKNIFIWTVLLLSYLNTCSQKIGEGFYFDIPGFTDGKIYTFIDQNNPENVHYWHMYTRIIGSDTIFHTDGLDKQFRPAEVFVEKLNSGGTELIDYYYIQYDSLGTSLKIPTEILQNEVYSFDQIKNKPLTWSVKYQVNNNGHEILTKNRTFIAADEKITVSGTSYNCMHFRDVFTYTLLNTGEVLNFSQESYYAEDIGLVKYKRTIPNGIVLDYQLVDIQVP